MSDRKKFLRFQCLPDDTKLSLEDVASLAAMPIEALRTVYHRGLAESTKKSKGADGATRMFAFANKNKKVYFLSDNDIREHYGLK